MDFPWIPKKDPRKEDPQAAAATPAEAAPRGQSDAPAAATDPLGQLEQMLRDAREQVAQLRTTQSSADAVHETLALLLSKFDAAAQNASPRSAAASDTFLLPLFEGLARKLDELEQMIRQGRADASPLGTPSATPSAATSGEAIGELAGQIHLALGRQEESFGNAFRHLYARMETGFEELSQFVRPVAPAAEEADALPAGIADWQRVVLGQELADNPAIAHDCRQLIGGVLHGQYEARALAGQLLVFQSVATEKLPTLLKDIGEAYYRWQPKARPGTGKFEEALVQWLQRTCDSAGIPNTIELVNPGERFDAGRHNSAGRGVEITQVLGWVVLRDNGKVYTKALVEVR